MEYIKIDLLVIGLWRPVVVRVVVVIGLTSLVVVVVVTLALMALRSSCRTSASALLTVGVGLDQYVALVALKSLYRFSENDFNTFIFCSSIKLFASTFNTFNKETYRYKLLDVKMFGSASLQNAKITRQTKGI